MRTSQDFASNPIGVPVDPSKMVVARDAGRPVTTCIAGPSPANFCRPNLSIRVCRWIDDVAQ